MFPAPAGATADNPLARHRPQLRYHSEERHFAERVGPAGRRALGGAGHMIYGHIAREGKARWLQYWLFYTDNPQDRGIVRTGRHEGDWEFMQLRLGRTGRPDLATLAQHRWAEACAWRRLRRIRIAAAEVPIVFVANGSHAIYSRPGVHDRPFPDPNDEADGRGRRVRPALERIEDTRPDWVAWPGRWGRSRAGVVPGEQDSPRGPRFQEDGRWTRPSSYHRERAIACGSQPPRRTWQTALTVGLGLLAAALAIAALRRAVTTARRRRRA